MIKNTRVFLFLIILLAIFLRYFFFIGLNLNDDLTYLNSAHAITQNNFKFSTWIFSVRLMMNYPIAFFFVLLGVSDFSASLYILLCSIGSVILAYLIGELLFDKKIGLLAAFFMAIFPLEIAYATTIVPDVPVAFYMALSVYFFLRGEKEGKPLWYLLSGIAIGLAWLVKGLALLILPFYFVYFIFEKIGILRIETGTVDFRINKNYIIAMVIIIIIIFLSINFYSHRPLIIKGDEIFSTGVASIDAFNTNKMIYWDAETNTYTNKESRGDLGIEEDLEYSVHGRGKLHTLIDGNYMYKSSGICIEEKLNQSYISPEVGDKICLKTREGNLYLLDIFNIDEKNIRFSYKKVAS